MLFHHHDRNGGDQSHREEGPTPLWDETPRQNGGEGRVGDVQRGKTVEGLVDRKNKHREPLENPRGIGDFRAPKHLHRIDQKNQIRNCRHPEKSPSHLLENLPIGNYRRNKNNRGIIDQVPENEGGCEGDVLLKTKADIVKNAARFGQGVNREIAEDKIGDQCPDNQDLPAIFH